MTPVPRSNFHVHFPSKLIEFVVQDGPYFTVLDLGEAVVGNAIDIVVGRIKGNYVWISPGIASAEVGGQTVPCRVRGRTLASLFFVGALVCTDPLVVWTRTLRKVTG